MLDKKAIEENLNRVADMLIINGTLLKCPGLWYGRMGAAVFFFHYGRYTGNELFEEYAIEIIEQIQKAIHQDSPVSYNRGLAGIGVGIEYLTQNGFLDIDTDDILEDFDSKITYNIMHHKSDNKNLSDGLSGLGQYLYFRLKSSQKSNYSINHTTNKLSMMKLVKEISQNISLTDRDLPDRLLFLSKVHALNIGAEKIKDSISQLEQAFSFIKTVNDPNLVLSLMQMATIVNNRMEEIIYVCTKNTLHEIEQKEALATDPYGTLFWLLRCDKYIKKTGLNTPLISQLEKLIIKHVNDIKSIVFKVGELSLKGCAGLGLACISMLKGEGDSWLDLYG